MNTQTLKHGHHLPAGDNILPPSLRGRGRGRGRGPCVSPPPSPIYGGGRAPFMGERHLWGRESAIYGRAPFMGERPSHLWEGYSINGRARAIYGLMGLWE